MKKNLKVNLIWFGLIIGLFLILKGLELSGIMNLYYIQILMGIGISILMGLGTNLVLGFSGQFHWDKLVSWQLVPIHQLSSLV